MSIDPAALHRALCAKYDSRTGASGQLIFPCVPTLAQHCGDRLVGVMRWLNPAFSDADEHDMRAAIAQYLQAGFQQASNTYLICEYKLANPQGGLLTGLDINFYLREMSLAERYTEWTAEKEGELFGKLPDAKVIHLARTLGHPQQIAVLDIGAGTGRNTLPLARMGHTVDAVEMTATFAQQLQQTAQAERLRVNVVQADILDRRLQFRPGSYAFAIASEVTSHFRQVSDLRTMLEKVVTGLVRGGVVLFNAFVTEPDFVPDLATRQMSDMAWSFLFTPADLAEAMHGLPLAVLSNESVVDYERRHTAPSDWPPTPWYEAWAAGADVFLTPQNSPMALRWIACRRV